MIAMILCFVALFVFAVLGIFSAKYRALFFEALGCTITTITLRPCQSRLDERIKSTIIASILQRSPQLAKIVHQNFAVLSVIFSILFFGSMGYSIIAVYNYVAYGNCNGPDSSAFCVFDAVLNPNPNQLSIVQPGVGPKRGNGKIIMVEFGCFSCPYTRLAQKPLREFLSQHPEISLEFRAFPIPSHKDSFIAAQAAYCADEQGKFWEYHDALFADENHSKENLEKMALSIGLDIAKFQECMASNLTSAAKNLERDQQAGHAAGIYGTPTFFINNAILVGPSSRQDFEDALNGKSTNNTLQATACAIPNAAN
jgi:protein-disulfide isomerase